MLVNVTHIKVMRLGILCRGLGLRQQSVILVAMLVMAPLLGGCGHSMRSLRTIGHISSPKCCSRLLCLLRSMSLFVLACVVA